MTTEELDQLHNEAIVSTSTKQTFEAAPMAALDFDKVSASMNDYMLKGWIMLNDGCPDCNTPLMRNQEATSQVCVNCEINPPVDPEEHEEQEDDIDRHVLQFTEQNLALEHMPMHAHEHREQEPTLGVKPNSAPIMILPPPTSALPALPAPGPMRPFSPVNNRASVLDPMMEVAKKSYRSPSVRPMGSSLNGSNNTPITPNTPTSADFPRPPPPPRSSTPLPRPPKTPPPLPKGPPGSKVSFPLPPGLPPSLISPPASPQAPKLMPRDKRRSPQSSVVVQGNAIHPPPNPLAARPTVPSRVNLPTPPSSSAIMTNGANGGGMDLAPGSNVADVTIAQGEAMQESTGMEGRGSDVDAAPNHTHAHARVEGHSSEAHKLTQTVEDENEDEKGQESHDEFEDAEEEVVVRPTETEPEVDAELKREQSERASRLMGQKMLQGWAMLQEACPRPACNGVPLMRSREKKEFCVLCETTFQREQDLEQGKYTIVPSPAAAVTAAAPSSPLALATTDAVATLSSSSPSSSNSSRKIAPQFPAPPTTMPPVARATSPASPASPASPGTTYHHHHNHRTTSPILSPNGPSRPQRDLNGRISSPIVLPPPASMSPSFGMTSQQILSRHQSEDLDKLAVEDEELRRTMHLIGKVSEFQSRSLPPVPPVPAAHASSISRPTSTYSNSSDKEQRHHYHHPRHHSNNQGHQHQHQHHYSMPISVGENIGSGAAPNSSSSSSSRPSAPASPEVQAIVDATHKTMATLLTKLEVYRSALEVSESAKESQALVNQIKGLMECLKACREVL